MALDQKPETFMEFLWAKQGFLPKDKYAKQIKRKTNGDILNRTLTHQHYLFWQRMKIFAKLSNKNLFILAHA